MATWLAEHNNSLQLVLRKRLVDEESPSLRSLEATSCAPFASSQTRPSLRGGLVPLTVPSLENLGVDVAVKGTKVNSSTKRRMLKKIIAKRSRCIKTDQF